MVSFTRTGILSSTICLICVAAQAQTPQWTLRATSGPSARSSSAMVYDNSRGVVMLYGGSAGPTNFGDTWSWNGSAWSQLSPGTSPSARNQHAMAFDTARGMAVLFGGNLTNDTYEWNGMTWSLKSPANRPSGRNGHAMAYDAAHSRTILFGGNTGSGYSNQTWAWNGTNWMQLSPANTPSARSGHAMVYDGIRQVVVLFGGYTGSVNLNDTWEWNGTNWTQRTSANNPAARYSHGMAFDLGRNVTVMFGGELGNSSNNIPAGDTWEWNGSVWTQQGPTTHPTPRESPIMAYDGAHGKPLLFGGAQGTSGYVGDSWDFGLVGTSTSHLFVANENVPNAIREMDPTTNTFVRSYNAPAWTSGGAGRYIAFDNQGRLWVTNDNPWHIYAIGENGTVLKDFAISNPGSQIRDIEYSAANGKLYLVIQNGFQVIEIDPESGSQTVRINTGLEGDYLGFAPDGNLYLTKYAGGGARVYNPTNFSTIRTVAAGPSVNNTAGIAFVGNNFYLSSWNSSASTAYIDEYRLSDGAYLRRVQSYPYGLAGMKRASDTSLWVVGAFSGNGAVAEVSIANGSVLRILPQGGLSTSGNQDLELGLFATSCSSPGVNLASVTGCPSTSVNPGAAISGTVSGNWWNSTSFPNSLLRLVVGWRDPGSGAAVGTPVDLGLSANPSECSPGTSFGSPGWGLNVPSNPGTYHLWAYVSEATSPSAAIADFQAHNQTTDVDREKRLCTSIAVTSPCATPGMSLASTSGCPDGGVPTNTAVSGTVSGNWWNSTSAPNTRLRLVVGWRDPTSGAARGTPVDLGQSGIPSACSPGTPFGSVAWSINTPTVTGTYNLWLYLSTAANAQLAITDFQGHSQTGDSTRDKRMCTGIQVVSCASPALTGIVYKLDSHGNQAGPLDGATVAAPGLGQVVTSSSGTFSFCQVAMSVYSVTVSKTGYYSVARNVDLTAGGIRNETFSLAPVVSSSAPTLVSFDSANGTHLIEGMPGMISFSATTAWNGTPGTVILTISGDQFPATLTDLGGGRATASFTLAAPSSVGSCSEVTVDVTNGEGLRCHRNTGVHISPVPGIVAPWFRSNIPWAPSSFALTYTETIPDPFEILPHGTAFCFVPIEYYGSRSKSLRYDLIAAQFTGSGAVQETVKFRTASVPVFPGVNIRGVGQVQLSAGLGLGVSLAGCEQPELTPFWNLGVTGKFGVGIPAVSFIPVVFPPAAPAIALLVGTPVVQDAVESLEVRALMVLGLNLRGEYPGCPGSNCQVGNPFGSPLSGTVTVGGEIQAVLDLYDVHVGAYAGCTATLPAALPVQPTGTIRGYLGVFAEYLMFRYSQEFGVEWPFGSTGAELLSGAAKHPINAAAWQPAGANLRRWGRVNAPTDHQLRQLRNSSSIEISGSSTEETILQNVTTVGNPSIVADSSQDEVVFSLLDPNKPWYASTDIGSLRSAGGSPWALGRVADDLQADFQPRILLVNPSAELAAWEQVQGDVSTATGPADVLPHLEIATSWLDRTSGQWTAPMLLTNNGVIDRDPQPITFGSRRGVLWIENEADASPGDSTHPDHLMYAEWNGSAWSAPQFLCSGPNGIMSFGFAADGLGEGHVVFVVDQDGDLSTKTDRELYSIATNGGVWETAVRLTNDSVEDSLPVLVAPNGNVICVWSNDGTVMYSSLATWNPQPVYTQQTLANQAPSLAGVTLPDGAAIAYTVQGSNGVDIFAAFYDAYLDKWSLPRQLTNDEHAESSLSLAYDGSQLVIAYLKTQTERNGVDVTIDGVPYHIDNVPQPGRTDLCVLRHTLGYDVAVNDTSLAVQPANPVPGTQATLQATIENRGDLATEDTEVAFYDGAPEGGGSLIGTTTIPGLLIAGAAQDVSIPWTVPDSVATHQIVVVVDPDQAYDDRDRSNNETSVLTVLADLTFATAWSDAISSTAVHLVASVTNDGAFSSNECVVSWRLGDSAGPEIGRSTVGTVAPSESHDVAIDWDITSHSAGTFEQVFMVVDPDDVVQESDETNNTYSQLVAIPNALPGDLNRDGVIDGYDFAVFLGAFGHCSGELGYVAVADLNGDGCANFVDYQQWLQAYRDYQANPQAAPPIPSDVGDMNADGRIDGQDIQGFVVAMLNPGTTGLRARIVADLNGDGVINEADVQAFSQRLLGAAE